jgi:putative tricarboxylic transport membrane protein
MHTSIRVLLVLAPVVLFTAHAADWRPAQNVEIIVNTSPGTGSDATGRSILQVLQERKLIDVPAAVVNKPGGGGVVGLSYLTQRPGNGHYLMVTSPTLLTNHITAKSTLNYTDTTPLAQLGSDVVVFAVRAESPIKTARDLADRLKADPGSLSIAIGNSAGSHNHIAAAQVAKAVGADPKRLKVVAFGGSAEGITALLGGHIDVTVSPPAGVMQHQLAGKVRLLAVASERRLGGGLATVPTWKELGIAAVSANWRSVVGPRGLGADQVRYWDQVFEKLAQDRLWKEPLEARLEDATYLNSRDTKALMESQYAALKVSLTDLGLAK